MILRRKQKYSKYFVKKAFMGSIRGWGLKINPKEKTMNTQNIKFFTENDRLYIRKSDKRFLENRRRIIQALTAASGLLALSSVAIALSFIWAYTSDSLHLFALSFSLFSLMFCDPNLVRDSDFKRIRTETETEKSREKDAAKVVSEGK
jgi:membrane glycosyltransferase